jgi:hypothetical protein
MDGAPSAIVLLMVRTMRPWGGAMSRSFSSYCAAKDSLNRTRVRRSQILQDCCDSSPTPRDCETVSRPYMVGLGIQCHGNLSCKTGHELAEFDPQVR